MSQKSANTLELSKVKFEAFTEEFYTMHEEEIISIASDVGGEYWEKENFLVDLPGKWRLSFVALMAGQPIAYAILSCKPNNQIHLHHFMVHRDFRGSGLGSLTIERCLNAARGEGSACLSLKVSANSNEAIRFYTRHGFEERERNGDYIFCTHSLTT